jgi:AcrR family transcriptional regulator
MPAVSPASSTRRRMSASRRREQLLDVTTQLALDQSFHGVSIEAVAQAAGVTRALIYQHFGDLDSLLKAVVAREMSRARAQLSETQLRVLSEGDPLELMLESLRAYLHTVRDHPATWRMVHMPPEGAPPTLRRAIERGRASALAGLTDAVGPVVTRDGAPRDAELTAHVLSAISDEYARLVLTDPERYTPDRLLEHARAWLQQPWVRQPARQRRRG